jgi:hypothetical protein
MRRFKFERTVGADTPSGATVVFAAGTEIGEGDILAGSLECCLARGHVTEIPARPDPADEFAKFMNGEATDPAADDTAEHSPLADPTDEAGQEDGDAEPQTEETTETEPAGDETPRRGRKKRR